MDPFAKPLLNEEKRHGGSSTLPALQKLLQLAYSEDVDEQLQVAEQSFDLSPLLLWVSHMSKAALKLHVYEPQHCRTMSNLLCATSTSPARGDNDVVVREHLEAPSKP